MDTCMCAYTHTCTLTCVHTHTQIHTSIHVPNHELKHFQIRNTAVWPAVWQHHCTTIKMFKVKFIVTQLQHTISQTHTHTHVHTSTPRCTHGHIHKLLVLCTPDQSIEQSDKHHYNPHFFNFLSHTFLNTNTFASKDAFLQLFSIGFAHCIGDEVVFEPVFHTVYCWQSWVDGSSWNSLCSGWDGSAETKYRMVCKKKVVCDFKNRRDRKAHQLWCCACNFKVFFLSPVIEKLKEERCCCSMYEQVE